MKRLNLILIILGFLVYSMGIAQERGTIKIPDIPGYKTLKGDFHMHTVFSDGQVWPTVRVEEAYKEGLDVISITDHIENRKYFNILFSVPGSTERPNIIPDHNMSYEMAKELAETRDIVLIKGGEITRNMPPGHHNAIFLKDINPLATPEWKDAFREAQKQEAFIFWNHPGWKRQQPDTTLWWEEHTWLYENGMMQGIEVFNGGEYYPEAHQWAIDKNLTFIANTDVHGPICMHATGEKLIRPMTLVFAKERSVEGVREALFDRRTLAFFDNKLAGNSKFLDAVFFGSISVEAVDAVDGGFQIIVRNSSDIPFELSKASGNHPELEFFGKMVLPADQQTIIKVYTNNPSKFKKIDLKLMVDNLLVAPGKGLPVVLGVVTGK